MIKLKSEEDIKHMREGGQILRLVFDQVLAVATPGTTTNELDKKAESLIKKYGATPSFKTVKNFYWSTCMCINEQIVHTPPSKRVLSEGDILTIDLGLYYRGFHTDCATTIFLKKRAGEVIEKFLETGKKALSEAIKEVRIGNYIGHISQKINQIITGAGYFIIKELAGHGVGRKLHEDPMIPGFLDGKLEDTAKIKNGMVLAIEVIYSEGTEEFMYEQNNTWSLITADKSLSACFEKTVAFVDNKSLILT